MRISLGVELKKKMKYGILWGEPLIFMKFFRGNLILFRGRPIYIFFRGKPIFCGSLNFSIKSEWFTFIVLQIEKKMEAFVSPIILITTVLSFTNSLSHTSLYLSLKTSFVYSNLFSLASSFFQNAINL